MRKPLKNKLIKELASVLEDLTNRYPDRNIMKIMFDASKFTGQKELPEANNHDLVRCLQRYYNGHD